MACLAALGCGSLTDVSNGAAGHYTQRLFKGAPLPYGTFNRVLSNTIDLRPSGTWTEITTVQADTAAPRSLVGQGTYTVSAAGTITLTGDANSTSWAGTVARDTLTLQNTNGAIGTAVYLFTK